MKFILVTGAAGFIGFSLANSFLNKGNRVYGIDNFDQYYSIKIKKKRLNILKNLVILIYFLLKRLNGIKKIKFIIFRFLH